MTHSSQRLPGPDMARGLLMILMALDHTSFFVAKIHPGEGWVMPLPAYPGALAFWTSYKLKPLKVLALIARPADVSRSRDH